MVTGKISSAAIMAAVLVTTGLVPACAQESAMFRGDLAHSGVYPGAAIATTPKLEWMFHTGGPIIVSPAVADGVVYAGSSDGKFYAVDAKSGRARWQFKTGARIASSAAVSDGTVFFESYDAKFYALDAATGKLKWTFATGGERRFAGKNLHGILPKAEMMPDPFDFYLSSPALSSGNVYFGSGDGNVYALDARTGALRWKFATGEVVHASPAVVHGTVFIGSWDSYFYALDAQSGALKWRFKTGDDPVIHNQVGIQSSAAVADGVVYFGCRDSNLYALDEKTGVRRWAFDNKGSWVIASPALRSGKLYAATSDTGLFYALDAKTGAKLFQLDFKNWPMFSSPAIVGDFAYIGSHLGKLFAIDLSRGRVAWQFETEGAKAFGAAYTNADGTPNYAAAFAGNFYDDLVAGVAKLMTVGAVLSSPTVKDGAIYFGSMDGNLYALTR
jgi:outer membrane protein assembly factor BamB